jgi:hypothetical protein
VNVISLTGRLLDDPARTDTGKGVKTTFWLDVDGRKQLRRRHLEPTRRDLRRPPSSRTPRRSVRHARTFVVHDQRRHQT